jgi:hypothetical protein
MGSFPSPTPPLHDRCQKALSYLGLGHSAYQKKETSFEPARPPCTTAPMSRLRRTLLVARNTSSSGKLSDARPDPVAHVAMHAPARTTKRYIHRPQGCFHYVHLRGSRARRCGWTHRRSMYGSGEPQCLMSNVGAELRNSSFLPDVSNEC